jgi:hypothetical protein
MSDPAERLDDDDRLPKAKEGTGEKPPERPDWLVGADEGAASETTRLSKAAPSSAEPVKLQRPADRSAESAADLPIESASIPRPVIVNRPPPAARPEPPAPPKPTAWTAAAASVPKLKVEPGAEQAVPPLRAGAPRDATRAASPLPGDDEVEKPARMSLSSFDDEPTPAAAPPAARVVRPLEEPWWIIALDALRSDRRVQLIVGGLVLVLIVWFAVLPRAEGGVSLGALRRNPSRYDSQRVKVHGRVGDVFPLGGGYAFYLMQGRDTIVVFTRAREPESNKTIDVVGTVSTGFLDGVARQSIFEEP